MKISAILYGTLLLLLLASPAQAQDQTPSKTWIFFADKMDAAGKTTQVEAGYISERAHNRRQLRASLVAPWRDAPLSPVYLKSLEEKGITVLHQSRWLNAVTVRINAQEQDIVAALPFVRMTRAVQHLAPEIVSVVRSTPFVENTAPKSYRLDCGDSCTQLENINAIGPLERGINGQGVLLGFIDTRFDIAYGEIFDHESLHHIRDSGRLTWRDFTLADSLASGHPQSSRHGMQVASTAVGYRLNRLIGPGHGATVLAATTEWAPFERNVEEDNFVAALEWMEAQGVDVVNTSLGYSTFDPGEHSYATTDMDGDTGLTTIAFDMAAALGVAPVSSAGNEGGSSWGIISTPADGDSVIAVGAVRPSGFLASFSSVGPTADGRIKPDVSAQGVSVYLASLSSNLSDQSLYSRGSGTSFSAPLVSGVVAQLLQVNPRLNPIDVRDILTSTASQASSPDNQFGWGIIDADAAVTAAQSWVTASEDAPEQPASFEVRAPYPNPFQHQTRFDVDVPHYADFVRLSIFNVLGQRVAVPFAGPLNMGTHRIEFRAASLPPGLYLYRLESEKDVRSGKMMLVR